MKNLSIYLIVGGVLLAAVACAPTNVQTISETSGKLPRPDRILVYDFAVTPDEVKLDPGIDADVQQALGQAVNGTPRTAQEIKVGHTVANIVADELVKEIKSYGLPAERALGIPHSGGHTLVVKGQILSIDEGNSAERIVIGLGEGRTSVQMNVQLYEVTPEGMRKIELMTGDAASGYKPGMLETMGVGALGGHLLVSTLVSGGLTAGSELNWATVEADGKRLAKGVAQNLQQYFASQGWIPQPQQSLMNQMMNQ